MTTGRLLVIGFTVLLVGCTSEGPTFKPTKAEAAKTKEDQRAVHQELKAERKGGTKKKSTSVLPLEPKADSEAVKPASEPLDK